MPTGRLILLLLLIVVAAVVVVLVLRRGSAQRDERRVEAAGIRGEAEGMAATMTGQDTFAQQAQERAEVARLEAEERAREAARLEAEAAEQRAAAEATRREYEATMRRADDVDPDVKESAFPPVTEQPARTAAAVTSDAGSDTPDTSDAGADAALRDGGADASDAGADRAQDGGAATALRDGGSDASDAGADRARDGGADASDGGAEEVPLSRAERRQAREHEEGSSWAAPAGPGAAAAGAAATGAVGASSWAARDEEEASPESERIASAADYRDEVRTDDRAGSSSDVYPAAPAGSGATMSQDSRNDDRPATADLSEDTQSPSGEWGGPRSDVDTTTTETSEG